MVMRAALLVVLLAGACGAWAGCGRESKPAVDQGGSAIAPPSFAHLPPRTRALQEAIVGADRITVRRGGEEIQLRTGDGGTREQEVLVDVRDPQAIATLLEGFAVTEADTDEECMCHGTCTFRFFARGAPLAVVTNFHGRRLRWHGGPWAGYGVLDDVQKEHLQGWLIAQGVDPEIARR